MGLSVVACVKHATSRKSWRSRKSIRRKRQDYAPGWQALRTSNTYLACNAPRPYFWFASSLPSLPLGGGWSGRVVRGLLSSMALHQLTHSGKHGVRCRLRLALRSFGNGNTRVLRPHLGWSHRMRSENECAVMCRTPQFPFQASGLLANQTDVRKGKEEHATVDIKHFSFVDRQMLLNLSSPNHGLRSDGCFS